MGDVPPDEDEIERQNKCLEKCRDDFLAIEDLWTQLYSDDKATVEQVLAEFKKAKKAHVACCADCVPRRRRFDDDAKTEFEVEGITFAGTGAGIALGGAIAFELEMPVVAVICIALGAGFEVMAFRFRSLNDDPFDPNFTRLPTPSFPKLPAVRPVRKGVTSSVAKAANAVLANQAKAIGLLDAVITALNRADTAAKAGDASAEASQVKAARDFAKEAADTLRDALSLRFSLASMWTGPGLDFTVSDQDAQRVRDDTIINGFPRSLFDTLKKLGVDQQDQDAIVQKTTILLGKLQKFVRFRDLLIDRNLRVAEVRLAAALDRFSQSQ